MRSPRLSDGPAWSRARIANRQWLERAFPAWGDDWVAEQSEIAWAERWWRLRRSALGGHAMPFVLLLDGRLIGEIGIDAVDALCNGGEASVWMVRDHGSAGVMNAASVLLIQHCFTAQRPIGRMISPVATAARKGRSPGLSAVGFRIEGTVARKVGDKGMVDHDIWVVHNTAQSRARVASFVASLTAADSRDPSPSSAKPMFVPLLRAALRSTRDDLRRLVSAPLPDRPSGADDVLLRPLHVRSVGPRGWRRSWVDRRQAPRGMAIHQIVSNGARVGTVWTATDPGTATHEIVASLDVGGRDPTVLRSAIATALLGVEPGVRAVVRVPNDADGRTVADDAMLRALGLTLVATFEGDPEGPHRWAGEQRWEASP